MNLDDVADGTTFPRPEVSVYNTSNGWLLRLSDDTLINVDHDDVALLWELAEYLCNLGGRYDAKRLWVGWKPGDKHHDIHPQRCADCACKCEVDQSTPNE